MRPLPLSPAFNSFLPSPFHSARSACSAHSAHCARSVCSVYSARSARSAHPAHCAHCAHFAPCAHRPCCPPTHTLSRRALVHALALVSLRALAPPPAGATDAATDTAAAATATATATAAAAAASASASTYDAHARTYDLLDGATPLTDLLGLTALRARLVGRASGAVLEVAVGTGLNLGLYDRARVTSVTGVDASTEMLRVARARVGGGGGGGDDGVRLVQGDAEEMRAQVGGGYDTVVETFSLCVFARPRKALREMRAATRRGGTVLLLENTRSPNWVLGGYQTATAGVVAAMSKGCRPDVDVEGLVRAEGFQVRVCEYYLGGTVVYLELGV